MCVSVGGCTCRCASKVCMCIDCVFVLTRECVRVHYDSSVCVCVCKPDILCAGITCARVRTCIYI